MSFKLKNTNYYKWSIEHGDYDRDSEATTTFVKKLNRKKRIKQMLLVLLYLVIVAVVSYMIVLHL
jgi:hypothetical protein